jgi:hypothetical protein
MLKHSACDLILSYEIEFSAVFCLIRAAHKFDFKVSYNLNTGGDQWKVTETYIFDRTSMYFSLQAVPDDKVPPSAMSNSELYPGVNISECL